MDSDSMLEENSRLSDSRSSMKRRLSQIRLLQAIITAVMFAGFCPLSLFGTTLNGRLSTACYGFEQEEQHFEFSERMDLSLIGIGHPGISAYSNFQLRKDLLHDEPVNSKLWSIFLDCKNGANHARIGRQSISSCLRRVSIDGIMLETGYRRTVSIMAFAGAEATDSLRIESWNHGRFMGARLTLLPITPARFTVGWLRSEGDGGRSTEYFGAETRLVLGQLNINSELGYDAVQQVVSDVGIRALYRIRQGLITADFRRTHPRFPKDSFFRSFSFEPTQRAQVGIQWVLKRNLQVFTQYSILFLEGDPVHGIESSIGTHFFTIGYLHSNGYGGELSGVTCSIRRRLFRRLELSGAGRFGWYSRASHENEERTESEARFGGTYEIRKFWSVGLWGEHITGRRYSSDFRILLRTTVKLKAGS